MSRRDFVNIPAIIDTGNGDLNKILNAMKENIELLCALRGDANNHAVVKGDIETDYPDTPADIDLAALVALKETLRRLMVDLKT
jgi:hypothetical protein